MTTSKSAPKKESNSSPLPDSHQSAGLTDSQNIQRIREIVAQWRRDISGLEKVLREQPSVVPADSKWMGEVRSLCASEIEAVLNNDDQNKAAQASSKPAHGSGLTLEELAKLSADLDMYMYWAQVWHRQVGDYTASDTFLTMMRMEKWARRLAELTGNPETPMRKLEDAEDANPSRPKEHRPTGSFLTPCSDSSMSINIDEVPDREPIRFLGVIHAPSELCLEAMKEGKAEIIPLWDIGRDGQKKLIRLAILWKHDPSNSNTQNPI